MLCFALVSMLSISALGDIAYRTIKIYMENPKASFSVDTFVADTTIVRAELWKDTTNRFDATGWVGYFRWGETIDLSDSQGMLTITGSVDSAGTTIDFTPVSNTFYKAVDDGFCAVYLRRDASNQNTTVAHGRLHVEASPEKTSVGKAARTFAINGSEYGPFTGSFSGWPFILSTNALGSYLVASNNLSDVGNAGTARANLGVYSTSTVNTLLDGKVGTNDYVTATNSLQTQIVAATNRTALNSNILNTAIIAATNITQAASNQLHIVDTNLQAQIDSSTNRLYSLEALTNGYLTTNTAFYGGDVAGTGTNLNISAGSVGLTEINTTSLDTRYQRTGTNTFSELWVNNSSLLGSELTTNGAFTATNGWIIVTNCQWNNSRIEMISANSGYITLNNTPAMVIGKSYRFSIAKGIGYATSVVSVGGESWSTNGIGTNAFTFRCKNASSNLVIWFYTTGSSADWFDDVTLKEITNGTAAIASDLFVGGSVYGPGGLWLVASSNLNELTDHGAARTNLDVYKISEVNIISNALRSSLNDTNAALSARLTIAETNATAKLATNDTRVVRLSDLAQGSNWWVDANGNIRLADTNNTSYDLTLSKSKDGTVVSILNNRSHATNASVVFRIGQASNNAPYLDHIITSPLYNQYPDTMIDTNQVILVSGDASSFMFGSETAHDLKIVAGGLTTPYERLRLRSSTSLQVLPPTNSFVDVRGYPVVSGASQPLQKITDLRPFATGVGGGLEFVGKYDAAGDTSSFGFIQAVKENSVDGNYAGALDLGTVTGDSPYFWRRMRIASGGNVGLGTTNPTYRLHLADGAVNAPTGMFSVVDADVYDDFVATNGGSGYTLGGQITSAGTAGNSTNLNGQSAAYYYDPATNALYWATNSPFSVCGNSGEFYTNMVNGTAVYVNVTSPWYLYITNVALVSDSVTASQVWAIVSCNVTTPPSASLVSCTFLASNLVATIPGTNMTLTFANPPGTAMRAICTNTFGQSGGQLFLVGNEGKP